MPNPKGYEYIALALMIVIQVCSALASPFGINRLLLYLETKGENAVVRPWVWISWLFLAPTIGSIAFQWYIYLAVRLALSRSGATLSDLGWVVD